MRAPHRTWHRAIKAERRSQVLGEGRPSPSSKAMAVGGLGSVRGGRIRQNDWLVTSACVVALFATLYVLSQLGVPLAALLAALLLACLAMCGLAALLGSRTRRKAAEALRALELSRRARSD